MTETEVESDDLVDICSDSDEEFVPKAPKRKILTEKSKDLNEKKEKPKKTKIETKNNDSSDDEIEVRFESIQ
jgi:hypothetical protein